MSNTQGTSNPNKMSQGGRDQGQQGGLDQKKTQDQNPGQGQKQGQQDPGQGQQKPGQFGKQGMDKDGRQQGQKRPQTDKTDIEEDDEDMTKH